MGGTAGALTRLNIIFPNSQIETWPFDDNGVG